MIGVSAVTVWRLLASAGVFFLLAVSAQAELPQYEKDILVLFENDLLHGNVSPKQTVFCDEETRRPARIFAYKLHFNNPEFLRAAKRINKVWIPGFRHLIYEIGATNYHLMERLTLEEPIIAYMASGDEIDFVEYEQILKEVLVCMAYAEWGHPIDKQNVRNAFTQVPVMLRAEFCRLNVSTAPYWVDVLYRNDGDDQDALVARAKTWNGRMLSDKFCNDQLLLKKIVKAEEDLVLLAALAMQYHSDACSVEPDFKPLDNDAVEWMLDTLRQWRAVQHLARADKGGEALSRLVERHMGYGKIKEGREGDEGGALLAGTVPDSLSFQDVIGVILGDGVESLNLDDFVKFVLFYADEDGVAEWLVLGAITAGSPERMTAIGGALSRCAAAVSTESRKEALCNFILKGCERIVALAQDSEDAMKAWQSVTSAARDALIAIAKEESAPVYRRYAALTLLRESPDIFGGDAADGLSGQLLAACEAKIDASAIDTLDAMLVKRYLSGK